jgi:serine protease AprX
MVRKAAAIMILAGTLILANSSLGAGVGLSPSSVAWQSKVDPAVLDGVVTGPTEYLVFLAEQADLSQATLLPDKLAKGKYVYETLTAIAERTQKPVRQELQRRGVEYQPFWVANMIWVHGDAQALQAMAARDDVAHIYANPTIHLDEPAIALAGQSVEAPAGIEWNITKVGAPNVWDAGFTGQGAVVGGQDTGYQWNHPALKGKYRGWDGAAASHDYNWHDAVHSGDGSCGANSPVPCDDNGHGTHTMGTMVGDDGGSNRIGMAPGARWIGCRNMDRGNGTPATYSECYQWFIAPTRVDGTEADSSKAPDVINNSWGCPASEGCTDPNVLLTVVQSVRAAGIVTVQSAGNSGPSCNTVQNPAAIYVESFSVGATNSSDSIASFSSRGPVTIDSKTWRKPDVSAPGVNIRSSIPTSTYEGGWQGTSMAGPHVAGAVALLISAYPWLAGDVDTIEGILEQSALYRTSSLGCGGDSASAVPNNVYGWGRIDVLAAYDAACQAPGAVTGAAIAAVRASTLELSWSPVSGATGYEVWDSVNAPYFTPAPGTSCAADPRCAVVTDRTDTLVATGGPDSNHTYFILSNHRCGATSTVPSNRVAEFSFAIVPGG